MRPDMPIEIMCIGCKAAIAGARTVTEVLADRDIPTRSDERPLTAREQAEAKLHREKDRIIRAHWKAMMGPATIHQHPTPMPVPGYDEIEQEISPQELIEQCLDKTFTGNRYVDGVRYVVAVIPIPNPNPDYVPSAPSKKRTSKKPEPQFLDPTHVALAILSKPTNHQRATADWVRVEPIEQAVDTVMRYKLAALVGPEDLVFGTYALAPLPDPNDARLALRMLMDRHGIVLPNIKRLYDPVTKEGELLTGGPMAEALAASAYMVAKKLGTSTQLIRSDYRSDSVRWGMQRNKVRDAFA